MTYEKTYETLMLDLILILNLISTTSRPTKNICASNGSAPEVSIGSIGSQSASVDVVAEIGVEIYVFQKRFYFRIENRSKNFYTSIEISLHPIRASDINFLVSRLAAIRKIKYAAVLEKSSYNGPHTNIRRQALYTRPQTADPADDQIYLNSGLRRSIQIGDESRVRHAVNFQNNSRVLSGELVALLASNEIDKSLSKIQRSDDQSMIGRLLANSPSKIEEARDICSDILVGSQQSDVRVKARSYRIVIARRDVHVARKLLLFAAARQASLSNASSTS
jgi:hypothetical protein